MFFLSGGSTCCNLVYQLFNTYIIFIQRSNSLMHTNINRVWQGIACGVHLMVFKAPFTWQQWDWKLSFVSQKFFFFSTATFINRCCRDINSRNTENHVNIHFCCYCPSTCSHTEAALQDKLHFIVVINAFSVAPSTFVMEWTPKPKSSKTWICHPSVWPSLIHVICGYLEHHRKAVSLVTTVIYRRFSKLSTSLKWTPCPACVNLIGSTSRDSRDQS